MTATRARSRRQAKELPPPGHTYMHAQIYKELYANLTLWISHHCGILLILVPVSITTTPFQENLGKPVPERKNQSEFKWGKRWWGFGMQWHQLDHTNNLHLTLDRQPHQHVITHLLQTGSSTWRPTNSVKALKDKLVSTNNKWIMFNETTVIDESRLTCWQCKHTHWHLVAERQKNNLDFTEARDTEWQWHQLDYMQVCTLLQTDNHTSIPSSVFYRPGALPATQPAASKHWRHLTTMLIRYLNWQSRDS